MKKLLAGVLGACLLLSSAGCGAPPAEESAPTQTTPVQQEAANIAPTEMEQASSPMHALVMPTVKEESFSEDGTLLFTLSFPRFQVILENQALEEAITGDLHQRMSGILSAADEVYTAAESDYPYADAEYWYPYSFDVAYTPTRLDQEVMSLLGNRSRYSGGAHPSWVTDSVTYDLQTGTALLLEDILCADYSKDTLCALVLNALKEKAETLSYGYEEIVTQRFANNKFPQWYFSRTGLCFHFPPYDIAPYSSGTVIAEIPYQELEGLLLEQYFPTAAENATGSMYAQAPQEDAGQQFTFKADVQLNEDSSPIVLYSDATVTDVRIETGTPLSDGSGFISTGVVFMADAVDIGDAISLCADLTDPDNLLRLVYRSGDHEVSSFITWDAATGSVNLTSS